MTGNNSGDPFSHIDEDEIERLAELATQRKRANGRIPTFGDDDYLDYVADPSIWPATSPLRRRWSLSASTGCSQRQADEESVAEKAVRYLAEGRVRVRAVTAAGIKAEVQGSAEGVYHTRREGPRWSCDCPAWQRECCHVRAVRLVT